jgi:hypothetical protein
MMQNLLGLFWIYKFLAYDVELAGFDLGLKIATV